MLKYSRIKSLISSKIRRKFIYPQKRNLGGKSVICNNCTGAMMLHDLGYRLDTPTVNLWMNTRDYMKLVNSLPDILFKEIEDITPSTSPYPIGLLDGSITLHFLHYSSFTEAISSWKRRAARVDMNHIYLLCVDHKDDGIDLDFDAFDALPYKNKIAITSDRRISTNSSYFVNFNI